MKNRILVILVFAVFAFPLSAAAKAAAKKPLPEEIHSVEEEAENAIDLCMTGDWTNAQVAVDSIDQVETQVEQDILKNAMPTSEADAFTYFLSRLNGLTAERKHPIQAASAANQILDILIDLQGFYAHRVPLDIARMDYLGREIVLDARIPDGYGLLSKRIRNLEQTWDRVEPAVKAHNGRAVAAQVDRIVADLKSGPFRPRMLADGNRLLDRVDDLEALFRKSPASGN